MKTNKEVLLNGIKKMGLSLILMFIGPTLLYVAFSNPDKPLYLPLIIISLIICTTAVYFAFKGINTILDSMFNNK